LNAVDKTAARELPSRRYAWYTVFLLTLVYVVSFVDRYILGLLVEPIKADMALTDTQIGLLLGPAFALFYTTMGIPLGWLADRKPRTVIVGVGAALWSLATMACGLAQSFGQLFIGRVAVGVGEATLSPCALSMIGDSFPPEKRGRPVAFYSAALSLGAGIAALVGATVITWSKTVDSLTLPLVGAVAPWQFAFLAVGIVGMPFAFLLFTLREPTRESSVLSSELGEQGKKPGLKEAFGYLRNNKMAYLGFVPLVCVMTTVAYSQGWLPAMFERTWGWPPEKYALYSGIAFLAVGPLTVNLSGWWSDRLSARGVREAPARILLVGSLILLVTGCAGPLMPTAWLAFSVLTVNIVGIAMVSAVAPTALLNITPGEIRGQIIAIYFLAISLAGLILGPMTVGLLNDWVMGEAGARYSIALVPLMYGLPVLLLVRKPFRAYRERVHQFLDDPSAG
jgi:MFS family permease